MEYEIKAIEYDTNLYKRTYYFRETNSANIILSFTLLDRSTTEVELISLRNQIEDYRKFETAIKQALRDRDPQISAIYLPESVKESTKFIFESIFNDYTEYDNGYLRYYIL